MASATTERLAGLVGGLAIKAPVRVATTAAITLSAEQTIDGVAVVEDDRVLVKDQAADADNGIYVCSTGTWVRAKDWDGSLDAGDGTLVLVREGTISADFLYKANAATAAITVGTTEVTFTLALSFGSAGATGALIAAAETESDAQDALGAGTTGKALFTSETDDAAIEALTDGATTRSPALSDEVPFLDGGTDGGVATVSSLLGLLRSHLAGLTLSRNATVTSLDIAAGAATDSTSADLMALASSITKSLNSTWVVGTGNGGLDTGAKANSTWYHIWLIKRIDTGVVDVLFSLSVSAPTMPASYTLKRRIGSVLTDSSGDLIAFSQNGDEFLWNTPVLDVDVANPGVSAVNRTLSVPTGVVVWAKVTTRFVNTDGSSSATLYLSELDKSDQAPSATASPLHTFGPAINASGNSTTHSGNVDLRTNTSAQIRSRIDLNNANIGLRIATRGWIDRRGRDD